MLFLLISMGCPISNNPSNNSFDLDDDGYFRDEDCDDSNELAFEGNGQSSLCPAYSCLEILENGHSVGDGVYWIDPAGGSPIEADFDMTTEGGGYTYYAVLNGLSTSRFTDTNSCHALGMDIVYPRSQQHWNSMLSRYSSTYFGTIPGVYKTANGGNYTYCSMNSNASHCNAWTVGDGGRWWLRSTTYTEPNGDYTAYCWLGTRSVASSSNITFNDANCNYSTSSYICSTNDKE